MICEYDDKVLTQKEDFDINSDITSTLEQHVCSECFYNYINQHTNLNLVFENTL